LILDIRKPDAAEIRRIGESNATGRYVDQRRDAADDRQTLRKAGHDAAFPLRPYRTIDDAVAKEKCCAAPSAQQNAIDGNVET
jgi:hypothetical protein